MRIRQYMRQDILLYKAIRTNTVSQPTAFQFDTMPARVVYGDSAFSAIGRVGFGEYFNTFKASEMEAYTPLNTWSTVLDYDSMIEITNNTTERYISGVYDDGTNTLKTFEDLLAYINNDLGIDVEKAPASNMVVITSKKRSAMISHPSVGYCWLFADGDTT